MAAMATALPSLYVIIISFNRRDDTLACLHSLQAAALQLGAVPNMRVLVLDNASNDGSPAAIRERFPQVELIELAENRGYAGNNNLGIERALAQGADWVLLLNDDVEMAPDCLRLLLAAGEANPALGALGPLVLHYSEPEVIQSAGGSVDALLRSAHMHANEPLAAAPPAPCEVDWLTGCALLIRSDALRAVGLLDEDYYLYWEETEWCLRAGAAGWRSLLVPAARLWHKGVQRDYKPGPNVAYYYTRNRLLTLAKQKAPARAWLVAYGEILRTLASYSVRPKWRPQRAHRNAMWDGLVDFHRGTFGPRPSA